jgi:hypothetical protein
VLAILCNAYNDAISNAFIGSFATPAFSFGVASDAESAPLVTGKSTTAAFSFGVARNSAPAPVETEALRSEQDKDGDREKKTNLHSP